MKTLPISIVCALCIGSTAPLMAATLGSDAVALSLSGNGTAITTIAGRGAGTVVNLTFEGGQPVGLDDLDYRPATGGLFGYDDETDTVYSIDLATGNATAEVSLAGATDTGRLGLDFNNRIDAARVVTVNEGNVVYNPNALPNPTLAPQTPLFYGMGDVNAGLDPTVDKNAYTNAVPNATATVQYVLDTGLDVLAILNNNAGNLTTVGSLFLNGLAFDAQGDGGFDILSFMEGDNTAYALFSANAQETLYTFSLTPDAQSRINLFEVAAIPQSYGALAGLTVLPAPIPLPASALLLLGGIGVLAGAARRRRA